MKQKQLGIAIRRFTAAITERQETAEVAAAVGTLIQTLAATAHSQATQVVAKIIDRLTRYEERMDAFEVKLNLVQRHLEQIDLVLDEQARAREVGQ